VWVGGFQNIIDHLKKSSDKRVDLDSALDRKGRANITAYVWAQSANSGVRVPADVRNSFSSFIEAHGQPLLNLSLYVSSENYNSITRPAFSRLLPWPKPWLITPQRRTLAKARTANLNLSALDIDNASSEEQPGALAKSASDLIPLSLRTTRQTVTSLVKHPQHASRFRLDALSEAFLEPLQHLLGQERFLLSDQNPSSLDCMALAYLALALLPKVPQSWLADSMKARYPELCRYVKKSVHEFFGGAVKVEDALPSSHFDGPVSLPWKELEGDGIVSTGFNLAETAFETLPVIGLLHKSNILLESNNSKTAMGLDKESVQAVTTSPSNPVLPAILAVGAIISGVAGYLLYSGLLGLPVGDSRFSENKRLSDMGEAGAMLGMVDFGGRGSKLEAEDTQAGRVPVGLKVDVVIDRKGAL